jgi:hypothetical protein
MKAKSESQSIVISGESGAGKTEATKQLLHYLAEVSGLGQQRAGSDQEANLLEQQILQANPLLEAFGNAKTVHNNNSSRFGKLICVHFNQQGRITGAVIINYLLEKSRVVHQPESERNFHVFHQLTAAIDQGSLHAQVHGIKISFEALMLSDATEYRLLHNTVSVIDGLDDADMFHQMWQAMRVLQINEQEQQAILEVTASLLHLGNLMFADEPLEDSNMVGSKPVDMVPLEKCAQLLGIDAEKLKMAMTCHTMGHNSVYFIMHTADQAAEARDAMCKMVYTKLFDWLVAKVNTSLATGGSSGSVEALNVNILDIFGFESFDVNSFEQLCINYCNEKLQWFFNQQIFALEKTEYEEQGISVPDTDQPDNKACLLLLEKPREGIFAMIDEEIRVNQGSDENLLKKILGAHDHNPHLKKPRRNSLVLPHMFIIGHYAGEVGYTITGFMEKNKDSLYDSQRQALNSSSSKYVKDLMAEPAEQQEAGGARGRTRSAAARRPTLSAQFKTQLSDLVELLSATEPHFVRCLKPNVPKQPGLFQSQMVLYQLRCAGLLAVCQLRKTGYPERCESAQFLSRYLCLVPHAHRPLVHDCAYLLRILEQAGILEKGACVQGKTKVFVREAQAQKLESMKLKIVDKATKIIQRDGRRLVERKRMVHRQQVLVGLRESVEMGDHQQLSHFLGQTSRLPHGGYHLVVVREASILHEAMSQEHIATRTLEAAMMHEALLREDGMPSLQAALAEAESLSAPSVEMQTLVTDGRKTLQDLERTLDVKRRLRVAISVRDLPELLEVVGIAQSIPLDSSVPELQQATALALELEKQAEEEAEQQSREHERREVSSMVQQALDTRNVTSLIIIKARSSLQQTSSWMDEASKRQVDGRFDQIQELKRSANDNGLASAEVEDVHLKMKTKYRWLADDGEVGEWRQSIERRFEDVQHIRGALGHRQVSADVVDKAAAAILNISWLLAPERAKLEKTVTERSELVVLMRNALSDHSCIVSAAALRSTLQTASSVPWLAEAPAWRSKLQKRVQLVSLCETAANGQSVAASALEQADEALKSGEMAWLEGGEELEVQLQERILVVHSIKAALQDYDVTEGLVAAAVLAVNEAASWLSEAPSWKIQLERRNRTAGLVMNDALADQHVSAAVVEEACGALNDTSKWFSVEASKKEKLQQRMALIERIKGGLATSGVSPTQVQQAAEACSQAGWLVEAASWTVHLKKRTQVVELYNSALAEKGVCFVILVEATEAIGGGAAWLSVSEHERKRLELRVETAKTLQRVAAAADQISAKDLESAAKEVDLAQLWLVEAAGWRETVMRRAQSMKLVVSALEARQVGVQLVEEAKETVLDMQSWLTEAAQWSQELHTRFNTIHLMRDATRDHEVSFAVILQATKEIANGALVWVSEADRTHWMAEVAQRHQDLGHIQLAVSVTEMVPVSTVNKAAAVIDRVLLWLANPEASRWNEIVRERVETITVLKAAVAHAGVSSGAVEQASELLSASQSWLSELKSWEDTVVRRMADVRAIKASLEEHDVSASAVTQGGEAIKRAIKWMQDAHSLENEIENRKRVISMVEVALADTNVQLAGLTKARQTLEEPLPWLGDAMSKKQVVIARLEAVQCVQAAQSESDVSLTTIEDAARVIANDGLSFMAHTTVASWKARIADRMKLIQLMKGAMADTAVPAATVKDAGAKLSKVLQWLADPDASIWQAEVQKRVSVIQTLQKVALATKVAVVSLEDAEEVVDSAVVWLAEGRSWQELITTRIQVMQSLKTAAMGINVQADAVATALKDASEAKAWLVEANKWQTLLTKRHQIINIVQQALSSAAVKAGAVETAARSLAGADEWLIEAEIWQVQLSQRAQIIKTVQRGANGQGIPAECVDTAQETLADTVNAWLVDTNGWQVQLDKRTLQIRNLQAALQDCTDSSSVQAAAASITQPAMQWLQEPEWRTKLQFREEKIKLVKAVVPPYSKGVVRMQAVKTALEALEIVRPWLKEAGEWSEAVMERMELIKLFDDALKEADVATDIVFEAVSQMNRAQLVFVEASRLKSQINRRADDLKRIKLAAEGTSGSVPMSLIDKVLLELEQSTFSWVAEKDVASWKAELVNRKQDVLAIKAALAPTDVSSDDVAKSSEALDRALVWLAEAPSFKSKLAQRVQIVLLVENATKGTGVEFNDLVQAQKASRGQRWLADITTHCTTLDARLRDAKAVQAALAAQAVPAAVVESSEETLTRVEWAVDYTVWKEQQGRRTECIKCIRQALNDSGVLERTLRTAGTLLAEHRWLKERAKWEKEIISRIKLLDTVLKATKDNVEVEWVEVATSAVEGGKLRWLEQSEATKIEQLVLERSKIITTVRKGVAEFRIPAQAVDEAGQYADQLAWLVEKWYLEWERILKDRVAILCQLRVVVGKQVELTAFDAIAERITGAKSWLQEADEWEVTINDRMRLVKLVQEGTQNNARAADVETAYTQLSDFEAELAWLKSSSELLLVITERFELIKLVRDTALAPKGVTPDAIDRASRALAKVTDWFAEEASWKSEVGQRSQLIAVVRKALAPMGVAMQALVDASMNMKVPHEWLTEAESWDSQLEWRMKHAKLLEHAAIETGRISASVVTDAELLECGWFGEENVKAIVSVREEVVKWSTAAVASTPTVSMELLTKGAELLADAGAWLEEQSAWRSIVLKRIQHLQLLDVAAGKSDVSAASIEAAAEVAESTEEWLTAAGSWKAKLVKRRWKDIGMLKKAVAGNVTASALQGSPTILQRQSWLQEQAEWQRAIDERINVVRIVRSGLASNHVTPAAIHRAHGALQGAMSWLIEAAEWREEVDTRLETVHKVQKALGSGNTDVSVAELEEADTLLAENLWLVTFTDDEPQDAGASQTASQSNDDLPVKTATTQQSTTAAQQSTAAAQQSTTSTTTITTTTIEFAEESDTLIEVDPSPIEPVQPPQPPPAVVETQAVGFSPSAIWSSNSTQAEAAVGAEASIVPSTTITTTTIESTEQPRQQKQQALHQKSFTELEQLQSKLSRWTKGKSATNPGGLFLPMEEDPAKMSESFLPFSPCNPNINLPPAEYFGMPLDFYVCKNVAGFNEPVPLILLVLEAALREEGGMVEMGIFCAPSGEQVEFHSEVEAVGAAKEALRLGCFGRRRWGAHTIATLIKGWFRLLPNRLLSATNSSSLLEDRIMQEPAHAEDAIDCIPEPQQTLLRWFLSLIIEIIRNHEQTQMSILDATVVVAPLFVDLVDTRIQQHGADHTPEIGFVTSDAILSFCQGLICLLLTEKPYYCQDKTPGTATDKNVTVGCRVRRGPQWSTGDQDGGEGSEGTVLSFRDSGGRSHGFEMEIPDLTAVVKWDTGRRYFYAIGRDEVFCLALA